MDRETDVDGLSLIDVSAEDDSLLSSPALKLSNDTGRTLDFHSSPATTVRVQRSALASTHHRVPPSESTEGGRVNDKYSALHDGLNCGADKQDNGTSLAMEGEQPLLSKEAIQPTRKRRAAQCNLRKSLAWDKAFFTSEGVLNPDELSLVNKTFKKSNETLLPVMEEEESVRSSLGSNCSLGEDDSALQCLEEKLFTRLQTSKPKLDHEVDKIHNAASCEKFPAQPLELPQSTAKHVATEKRHIAMKVVETPLQKKAALGSHAAFTSKRSSAKATEELQKASQSNDACAKSCSAAPPVTKNLSKGHKRMKYTHGNAVPATLTRASYHRNSPAKIKENFGITGRSFPSPNSSGSDNLNSEKCPSSSSGSFEKLRKSLFEMPKEVAPGTPNSARNVNLFGTSGAQFLHGMPACHSSMVSSALTGNSSLFLTHTSRDQFAPSIEAGTSADSAVSQCGKNREFKSTMAGYLPTKDDSISIACNSMIFSAKDPKRNSGNALPENLTAKSSGLRMPTKDDSISIASNSMIFSAKDPPSNPGNALPITFAAKPSGLRMPSPKLGFFDSTKVIRPPYSSALHRKSAGNRLLPPKPTPRGPSNIHQGSRLKPPGVPCAIPSSGSMSNFSFPNYSASVPPSTPMTSNWKSGTTLKSSVTSLPAPPFQPQVKPDSEASGLVLLAQKKFGVSKAQQSSSVQRSDQKQAPSDICNADKAVTAEDIERKKTNLRSHLCQFNQYNHATVADENQTQLRFSQGRSTLQDIPQMDSEAITETTIGRETSPDTEPGKISNMNVVSDILVNRHISKGSYGRMAEENQTQLRFSQGKSSLQDIPQLGSEAITATTIDTETSPSTQAGKISNMNVVSDILVNLHIPKGSYEKMAEENQTQLPFSHGKTSLQGIPQLGSKAITAATIDTETSPATEAGKISKMNGVSDILVNLHIPKGSYDEMAEESRTRLSFMRGKSTSQDICQTGPEATSADRNDTDTSSTSEIGKGFYANNDNIPQPGQCHRMAVLSDAMTNYQLEPLQPEQLIPPPCSKTEKVSEKLKLETCPDLIRNEEYNGLLNDDSDGTMRDDKVENAVSVLGSSLQQENNMKLVSSPVTLEHLPSPRKNSDLCSSLQENEMEPVSQPVISEHLPSPFWKEIEKVSIGLDIAATTAPVSVHSEKQDVASCQVSQKSLSTQDEDLDDNVRTGNSNLVCRLQLENEFEPASQLVKFEQSPPKRQGEIQKVTEEFPNSETSSLEKGLYLVENKVHDRTCTKVCQGSMNIWSDYTCDKVKSILSDMAGSLEFKTGMEFNPKENDFPANASNSSNYNQDSTTITLSTSFLQSGCPSHESALSVIEHKSEYKDDPSLVNVKLSHSSVTLEAQMKSELKGAGKEVKFNGRSPLAANYRLLNSIAQEISQKHVKEQGSPMDGTGRLASLPMSFPVSDDKEDKENSRPEGQDGVGLLEGKGADSHSNVSSGIKSMGNLSIQVQKIKNPLDASPFSEEWIAAIQAVDEEWLQMKRGPVQNSPPNKIVPQPGPWSPVRRHNQQLGPFDCTKYTNAADSSDVYDDE